MSMKRNPQTLGIERPPRKPVPNPFNPGGMRYKVADGDDWKSVAKKFNVDASTLIYFNFHTNNPDEVNWYLRRNVGCNKPTPDGFNWKFSSSAHPGFIYIPVDFYHLNVPPEWFPEPKGRNALARWLDNLPEEEQETISWEAVGFILDIVEIGHVAAGVFEIGVLESLGLELAGPIAGFVAFWLELGGAHKAAIDHKKRDWALSGLSIGAVLGANGANNSYIKWNFQDIAVRDSQYPEQNINFEKYYKVGLWSGVAYGRQLNRVESGKLFKILHSKMRWDFNENTKPWSEWSDYTKREYYKDAAAAFRSKFLPR